jgi:hypothetical protein
MTERTFTFTLANETISAEKLDDGSHVVKEGPDGTKILAYIENGELARYTAEDSEGNRKPLLSIARDIPGEGDTVIPVDSGSCMICYFDKSIGAVFCYTSKCPASTAPGFMGPHIP